MTASRPRGRPKAAARITPEDRAALAPADEKDVLRTMVANELAKHPGGVTAQVIATALNIGATTARTYLDYLVAVREALRHNPGGKLVIYLPNGRHAAPLHDEPFEIANRFYTVKGLNNQFGEMVLIQERKRDEWGVWKTVGGVIVDKRGLRAFAERLLSLADTDDDTGGIQR